MSLKVYAAQTCTNGKEGCSGGWREGGWCGWVGSRKHRSTRSGIATLVRWTSSVEPNRRGSSNRVHLNIIHGLGPAKGQYRMATAAMLIFFFLPLEFILVERGKVNTTWKTVDAVCYALDLSIPRSPPKRYFQMPGQGVLQRRDRQAW